MFLTGVPTVDIIGNILIGLQLAEGILQTVLLIWVVKSGWKWILRTIGFSLDLKFAQYIGMFYGYFLKMLDGTILNENVINDILNNVYVFIGVILLFRLFMVLVKYLINPDLISDAKLGANSLIKRVIIGIAGILLMPTIFNIALDLQHAILADNLIQQIIIPKDYQAEVKKISSRGGQYIATYVLAGFVSPNENASQKNIDRYNKGIKNGDLGVLEHHVNDGGFMNSDKYEFDYAYVITTMVMGYVLLQMAKYCLDLATRCFKLLLYRMLAPVAMIEYMIKGPDDGVFKSWRSAVLGTYFMIFVRVMAIWFVIFLCALMQADAGNIYVSGSLIAEDDNLLRAIILIAMLAFMMDLPKYVGQVFGLDLEQQSSADGLLKNVTGVIKGAVVGAVAAGGAAVGGVIGTGKQAIGGLPLGQSGKSINDRLKEHKALAAGGKFGGYFNTLGQTAKGGNSAVFGAMMGSNEFTKSAYGGYQSAGKEQEAGDKKATEENKYWSNKRKQNIEEQNAEDEFYARRHKFTEDVNDPSKDHDRTDQSFGPNTKVATRDDSDFENSEKVRIDEQPVTVKIDASSLAGLAGAMAGGTAANGQQPLQPPNQQGQQPQQQNATVHVQDIDVVVDGKATATYNGGIETNIQGKATTTYNGDLETTVQGKAVATYNGDLEANVNGKATGNYNGDIETNVSGKAVGNYTGDVEANISGNAKGNFTGDVNVDVAGNTTEHIGGTHTVEVGSDTIEHIGGTHSRTVDGDTTEHIGGSHSRVVDGNTTEHIAGSHSTIVDGNTTTHIGGSVNTTIDRDSNVSIKQNSNVDVQQDVNTTVHRDAKVKVDRDINVDNQH